MQRIEASLLLLIVNISNRVRIHFLFLLFLSLVVFHAENLRLIKLLSVLLAFSVEFYLFFEYLLQLLHLVS